MHYHVNYRAWGPRQHAMADPQTTGEAVVRVPGDEAEDTSLRAKAISAFRIVAERADAALAASPSQIWHIRPATYWEIQNAKQRTTDYV